MLAGFPASCPHNTRSTSRHEHNHTHPPSLFPPQDPEELAEYRLRKRKEFEDLLRRVGKWQPGVWVKYATWEEAQKDFRRARSVWERALDNDYRSTTVWLKYAEMEMRHRFVNHARNVWDRAVALLPRVDQLWYKYVHMEEMLGNLAGARQVFERWMKFEPDHQGWMAYIKVGLGAGCVGAGQTLIGTCLHCIIPSAVKSLLASPPSLTPLNTQTHTQTRNNPTRQFELRYEEVERARAIYERYVEVLPSVSRVTVG